MKNEAFLTTEEVLEYLQINLRTVYRLIKAGKIPAIRVGRQWRFRKADLDAWLTSQQTSSTAVTTHRTFAGRRPANVPGSSSSTTKPAFARCCQKLLCAPTTMSISRPAVLRPWTG